MNYLLDMAFGNSSKCVGYLAVKSVDHGRVMEMVGPSPYAGPSIRMKFKAFQDSHMEQQ